MEDRHIERPELNDPAIVVFTSQGASGIVATGGSGSWRLNASRAEAAKWLICEQNRNPATSPYSGATAAHREAFLVGRICGVREVSSDDVARAPRSSPGADKRWLILIDRYALVSGRVVIREGMRPSMNPVRYAPLGCLQFDGQDWADTTWRAIAAERSDRAGTSSDNPEIRPLTIRQAKRALSLHYEVPESRIEILIRG